MVREAALTARLSAQRMAIAGALRRLAGVAAA
jgi:hypothetical protein